ncbi:MAG: helix-turn-helix domain-containing protein [Chloroflexota bacterium]|nr:helix-turn-helix domain-containing protein [Chloroflexota bacterium]
MTDRETTKLGEVLRTAREARFIDLARVERDTRIRRRYLSALELGDYRDLPPPVYTKGFLRNYGLYLGLDPEYLVDLYRLESGTTVDRQAVPLPRRPVAARQGRSLVITSNVVAAAILTVMVVALVVYLVNQLMTFGRIPELRITDPVSDVTGYSGTEYTIRGQTEPESKVTTSGLPENPTATADATGAFKLRVALLPGANVIILTATDPLTDRRSAEVRRTITVLVQASPTPSSAPSLVP